MMKNKIILLAIIGSFITAGNADPIDGWTSVTSHFEIQSPYNLKHSERYDFDAQTDTHHLWVLDTDKPDTKSSTRPPRTEMSFDKYISGRAVSFF